MRRMLAVILTYLESWLDDAIDPDKLKSFVNKYAALIHFQPIQPLKPDPSALIGSGYEFLNSDSQFVPILTLCKTEPARLKEKMESLLRHIEVRRKACFKAPGIPHSRIWRMRHRAAMLLCAYAGLQKDLRFLNAALKLNDWSFARYQNGFHQRDLPLYITALQIQETAIKELLP